MLARCVMKISRASTRNMANQMTRPGGYNMLWLPQPGQPERVTTVNVKAVPTNILDLLRANAGQGVIDRLQRTIMESIDRDRVWPSRYARSKRCASSRRSFKSRRRKPSSQRSRRASIRTSSSTR